MILLQSGAGGVLRWRGEDAARSDDHWKRIEPSCSFSGVYTMAQICRTGWQILVFLQAVNHSFEQARKQSLHGPEICWRGDLASICLCKLAVD